MNLNAKKQSRMERIQKPESPLIEAGKLLKQRRESYGISLRDLARETKITIPVLEAIERGWIDRLPEPAYLCSMLPLLEERLELNSGSLSGALPERNNRLKNAHSSGKLRRFTPGNIDIFTTWQGSVVYALVMFGTFIILNQQQQRLKLLQSNSIMPIAPRTELLDQEQTNQTIDKALSGLRPLRDLNTRSPEEVLTYLEGHKLSKSKNGLLVLNLKEPRTVKIKSGGGDRSNLINTQGELILQLQQPVQLIIQPPPNQGDQLTWNGNLIKSAKPGVYNF